MTAQEQQMIQSLADRINTTSLAEKDPDAEQFLQQALGRNPDALYILAQTMLVQQYALEQAQRQLADVRAQLEQARQPKPATSFLGTLLGNSQDPAPPPPPPRPAYPQQYTPVPEYGQSGRPYVQGGSSFSGGGYPMPPSLPYGQPPYGQPQYGQPQYGPPQSGGFLRSAMQTAAGVAAGALAFEGIEGLMHGFGGSGGSSFASGMGGGRPEEIINNNYYGDANPGEHSGEHSGEHRDLSSDIEDRRNDSPGFDNAVDRNDHNYGRDDLLDPAGSVDGSDNLLAGTDDSNFDGNTSDDSSYDDSGSSDGSSFDDGN